MNGNIESSECTAHPSSGRSPERSRLPGSEPPIIFDHLPLRPKLPDLLTPSSLIFQWKNKLVVIGGEWVMYTFALALKCG